MDWDEYKEFFEWDGALRDLYVLDTSLADWNNLGEFLRNSPYTIEYKFDDQDQPLPDDLTTLFADYGFLRSRLYVHLAGLYVNWFFCGDETEIEFDIDPREVTGPAEAEAIFDFMSGLGRALDKEVYINYENGRLRPTFVYSPLTDQVSNPIYEPIVKTAPEKDPLITTEAIEQFIRIRQALEEMAGRLRDAGATPADVCSIAGAEGMGNMFTIMLLRQTFAFSYEEAQEVAANAGLP